MKTIKYYDGTKNIAVEVSDDVAQGYQEIKREEWRQEYHIRTKNISSNALEESGFQFEDKDSDLQANIDRAEESSEHTGRLAALQTMLTTLTPEQRQIIALKFYQQKNDTEIGQMLGITRQAVQSRIETIFKKIKKVFENCLALD